jgi:hypothetical protein
MPAYHSKMRCIYDTEPTPKKPRIKKVLTDEEKEAALKREINKLLRAKKKEWEATLKPWKGGDTVRLPMDTVVRHVAALVLCHMSSI